MALYFIFLYVHVERGRSAKPNGEGDAASSRGRPESARRADDAPEDHYMGDLFRQLTSVVKSTQNERFTAGDGKQQVQKHFLSIW